MPSKQSALDKKRLSPVIPANSKQKKKTKTVDVKLQEPTEEEKKEKILAAFTTPSEDTLKNFRKICKAKKQESAEHQKSKVNTGQFLAKPPTKGKKYFLDLRIRTPGTVGYFVAGGINPGPALTRLAKVKGLDMIGLTNFHDVSLIDKLPATSKAGEVAILPGIDLRCSVSGCNEVYFVALFPEGTKSEELKAVLDELQIPSIARGKKNYTIDKGLSEIIKIVENRGGVLIPSRLDKTPYRQSAIPALVQEHGFRVFDLVHPESIEYFKENWPRGGFTFLSFSNADALAQIGTRTASVKLATGGFSGLKQLVKRQLTINS